MLTIEEKATNHETWTHIHTMQKYMNVCIHDLIDRGHVHDQSKLGHPEVEMFAKYTAGLQSCPYGSPEYEEFRKALGTALEHHYSNNSHHPEYQYSNEEWKDIIGYEGFYQISTHGRIKSLDRIIYRTKQGDINKKSQIISAHITPKGYCRVQLTKNKKYQNCFIHTLVANHFLDKQEDIKNKQVNHIDGNKLNNHFMNLEYLTPSQNLQHAYENNLKKPKVKYVIYCKELDITTFGLSKMEKKLRELGYDKACASSIYRCISNENSTHLDLTFIAHKLDDYEEINSMISKMNLLDIMEMFCDWKASSERHNDGNIRKSIEINADRFNMCPQLVKIFENTAEYLS